MINTQRLVCTVIKFHVVEETKEAKEAVRWALIADDNCTARYRSNLQFIDS